MSGRNTLVPVPGMSAPRVAVVWRGWVRNRLDGSVEAVVQGGVHEVNRMVEWARGGPPNAVVTSVDIFSTEGGAERRVEFEPQIHAA